MKKSELNRYLSIYDKKQLNSQAKLEIVSNKFKRIGFKLYKYYSLESEYTLDNIKNDIIFLNRADAFNDPFDCNLGYSYLDCVEEFCLNLIMNTRFNMSDDAVEAFTKFIFDEELMPYEIKFLNESIKNYGKINSDTKINDWYGKSIDIKLPLICDLLCDEGKELAEQIINASHKMVKLQNNIRYAINNNFTITCFSEEYNNELMWAHYADKHRGICVEYDLSKFINDEDANYYKFSILPVIYSKTRPQIPIRIVNTENFNYIIEENDYSLSDRLRYLLTKSSAWKYEKEWRMILVENKPQPHNFPFVSKIYLGANISLANQKQIEELAKIKGIETKKMILSKDLYKLI